MNEMQGAVGKAQLKKLSKLVKKQNLNYRKIWDEIKNFKEIKLREIPKNSYITADALIFSLQSKKQALKFRKELLKRNIMTKILPEAINWHFAGKWEHIKCIFANRSQLKKTQTILSKSVSIPIFFNMDKNFPSRVKSALIKAIRS